MLRMYHLLLKVRRASHQRCLPCYLPYKAGKQRVVLIMRPAISGRLEARRVHGAVYISPEISGELSIASVMLIMLPAIKGGSKARRVHDAVYVSPAISGESHQRCLSCYLPYEAGQQRVVCMTLPMYYLRCEVNRASHQQCS